MGSKDVELKSYQEPSLRSATDEGPRALYVCDLCEEGGYYEGMCHDLENLRRWGDKFVCQPCYEERYRDPDDESDVDWCDLPPAHK